MSISIDDKGFTVWNGRYSQYDGCAMPFDKWKAEVIRTARTCHAFKDLPEEEILSAIKREVGYDYSCYANNAGAPDCIEKDVSYANSVASEYHPECDDMYEESGPYGGAFASDRDCWNYRDSGLAAMCDWR